MNTLALDGGTPVRETYLPYGKQSINQDDINAVVKVLQSDWITTGPNISAFEKEFASFTGAKEAVAVSSGTAALHTLYYGIGITKGDEVIVPTMTFAATANAVAYLGAKPVFADCNEETLLIDPSSVESLITDKTKAICAVDYGGQPADYDALQSIADNHNLLLVSDACHALGAGYKQKRVGNITLGNTFSFHPVKPLATGEGGMVTTNDLDLAKRMRVFRNHAITTDHRERQENGSWFYEQVDLGYNYRLTDFQCALGKSQLERVSQWTKRRQEIAALYNEAFMHLPAVTPLSLSPDRTHAYHLYVIKLELDKISVDRSKVFQALQAENIGVNVHYIPVHYHPYYRNTFHTHEGMCPVAEATYAKILSLPIFPSMQNTDVQDVVSAITKVVKAYT